MKSRIFYASLIMTLLVWIVAFGEILESKDWYGDCGGDPEGSSPSVSLDGSDNSDSSTGDGWQYTYTTEDAYCYWSIYVYAYAEADLWLYDGETCSATAVASAYGSYPMKSWSQYASVSLSDSGYGGEHVFDTDIDEPNGISKNGQFTFEAYEGIDVDHSAYCDAWLPSGGDCEASSHGCAEARGSMSD